MVEQVILASPKVARRYDMATLEKAYTLAEVDMQLEFLTNILEYSENSDREKCLIEIDVWLDRRIEVVGKYAD